MPDGTPVQVNPIDQTGAPATAAVPADVLQALVGAVTTLTTRLEKLEAPAAAPAPTPTPTPTTPPARGQQQSEQEYTTQLRAYAIAQAIEAARYQTAAEFGIDVKELQGQFDSKEAMQLYAGNVAKMKALEKSAQDTQQKLDALLSATPVPPSGSAEPTVPVAGNTGGPTGTTLTGDAELEAAYAQVRNLGHTEKAQLTVLDIMYRDPSKRVRLGPPGQP